MGSEALLNNCKQVIVMLFQTVTCTQVMERSIVLVTILSLTKPTMNAFSSIFWGVHMKGIFNVYK